MLATATLALTLSPIVAQAAPAAPPRIDSRIEGPSEDLTTTHWVLIFIGVGLLIWGIIELTDDEEPSSP